MVKKYYTPETYDVRKSVAYLIRTGANQLTTKVEALFAEKNLTFTQYAILMNLRYEIASNCGELCEALRYDSGALTRVIDQLEERGYLERERSKTDRRVIKLKLTPQGFAECNALMPVVLDQYNVWLDSFTKEEVDTLVSLMTRLLVNINAAGAGA